jgi:hypothetical protein
MEEPMNPTFLDWDAISYKEFRKIANTKTGKRSRGWMKNRLRHLRNGVCLGGKFEPVSLWYRRSAGGRVHVKIVSKTEPYVPESLLVRVYLDDDHARVDMDITRYSKDQDINRLFDTKYQNGKIGHAGPWVKWFSVRT